MFWKILYNSIQYYIDEIAYKVNYFCVNKNT